MNNAGLILFFVGSYKNQHFSQAKRETSRENYGESEFEEIQTDYTLEDDENDDLKDEKEINDEASHESEDRSCRFQKSTFEIIGTLDFINNPDASLFNFFIYSRYLI